MPKRGAVLFLFIVVIGIGWIILRNREPRYADRPLSAWVRDLGDNARPQGPTRPRDAIAAIGTNAIPFLLDWIREEDGGVPRVRRIMRRIGLMENRGLSLADVTPAAFHALGPAAIPAIPQLAELAGTPDGSHLQSRALMSLTTIGPPAHPAIFSLLSHTNPQTRFAVAYWIRSFGTNAIPATTALLKGLSEPPAYVQTAFADNLGFLQIEPAIMVPALIKTAGSNDSNLREASLKALARYGTNARPALPLLIQARNTPGIDVRVRGAIAEALNTLVPEVLTNASQR